MSDSLLREALDIMSILTAMAGILVLGFLVVMAAVLARGPGSRAVIVGAGLLALNVALPFITNFWLTPDTVEVASVVTSLVRVAGAACIVGGFVVKSREAFA